MHQPDLCQGSISGPRSHEALGKLINLSEHPFPELVKSFTQRKDIVRYLLQEDLSSIHVESGLEEEGRLEAGMEKREPSSVEEISISKCRLFYMHCPASGSACADNDSPYTVLTSGLAGGQGLPLPSAQHTGPIQYHPFRRRLGFLPSNPWAPPDPGEMTGPGNLRDSALAHHAQLPYCLGGHGLSWRQQSF